MRTIFTAVTVASLALGGTSALAGSTEQEGTTAEPRGAEDGLGEVLVTASRHVEDVQKSSLDIQVISASELVRNGVVSHRDLVKLVPGGQFGTSNLGVQTYIRGVGSFGEPPTVPWTLDGVVLDTPSGIHTNIFDLARIEVLKGPQGTLYGRNATGGAINLVTNRPEHDSGGYFSVEAGNYDLISSTGAVNLSAGDTLAFRGAFQALDRSGYLSDGTNDDERYAIRTSLLWEPNEDVSLYASADYGKVRGRGLGVTLQPRPAGTDEWTGILDPRNLATLQVVTGGLQFPPRTDVMQQVDTWGVTAELNANLSFATLTLLPAYRWSSNSFRSNSMSLGVSGGDNTSQGRQTTVEARLANSTARLKWLVGAYYYHLPSKQLLVQSVSASLPGFNPLISRDFDVRSYAGFAEGTASLTEKLRFIAGTRFTTARVEAIANQCDWIFPARPCRNFTGSVDQDKVTWKTGLEYDLGSDSMAYLTVATGFKAGGVDAVGSWGPENLLAYTLGSRNRFLENKLQVNAELFYWDYTDQQISATSFTPSGAISRFTFNAGKSEIYGADLDIVARLSSAATIQGLFEYLHTELESFQYDFPAILLSSLNTGCTIGPVHGTPAGDVSTLDCSGFPLTRAPEWSGTLTYSHVFDLASGANLTSGLSMSYASSRWLNLDYLPGLKQPDYTLADADLTYNSPSGRWSLTGYVRNIAGDVVYNGALPLILNTNYTTFDIGAPRTYGVRANVNF